MDRKTGKLIHNYIGANQLKYHKMSRVKNERKRNKRRGKEMFYKKNKFSFYFSNNTNISK